jgi:hypothetical protein
VENPSAVFMMKIVNSTSKTTLLLSGGFQPIGYISARAAMRNIMVGSVKAYDLHGNIHDWASWLRHSTEFPPDYPFLRSVDREWPIPTIEVVPGYFGHAKSNRKKNRNITLRQLYRIYDGICAYCHKEMPYSAATRDHVYPRSKGGSNDTKNIVLSCKKCNLKKGSKFPYFDIRGAEVKPRVLSDMDFVEITCKVDRRPEWETFLK